MIQIFQAITLGIIQGLTEFLPVSSSGHLIIIREFLGINQTGGLTFDAILQLGTVLAVFVYFRQDVFNLLKTALLELQLLPQIFKQKKIIISEQQHDRRLFYGILIGTLPALAIGLLLEDLMETIFRSPLLVAGSLILGSLLFFLAEKIAKQKLDMPRLKQSWWIGCFQTLALIPGISRSGASIAGGLLLGLKRDAAARFSFLLSIPIITGSGLKKLLDIVQNPDPTISYLPLFFGFVSAFAVGLVCIKFLITYLKNHTLNIFAWYRISLATVIILVFLFANKSS